MKRLFFFLLLFSFFPSTLHAEDVPTTSSVTTTEKRGLFSTMDSIQNQKVQITELGGAIILEQQTIESL